MSSLLVQDQPLLVPRKLAAVIGLNEALFLQQLHYWVSKSTFTVDGRKWIYNTYEAWGEQFPFWSISTIRRVITSLKQKGLIKSANLNRLKSDQTKWYTIHYEALQVLEEQMMEETREMLPSDQSTPSTCTNDTTKMDNATDQTKQPNRSTWTDDHNKLDKSLPKSTSKNSPKSSSKILKEDDEERTRETNVSFF